VDVDREEASRRKFDAFYADIFATRLGLPASLGRIAAALMLAREPLTQADLRDQLSLSEGSVSEGLRLLVEHGHVERAGDPRARPAYFQIRAASWPWTLDSIRTNLVEGFRTTYENLLNLRKHYDEFGIDGPARELVERSQPMYDVLMAELPGLLQRAQEAGERVQVTRPPHPADS